MIRLVRRHRRSCPHKSETYRRCQCPIYAKGTLGRLRIKQSLKITSWEKALGKIRDWELQGFIGEERVLVSIAEAIGQYWQDCTARHLSAGSMKKLKSLLDVRFVAFCNEKGLRYIHEMTVEQCRVFRAGWKDSAISQQKNLERFKAFLRFCHQSKWIVDNPAHSLKPPVSKQLPTLPFSKEEFISILAACDRFKDSDRKEGGNSARRVKAFILLLRYSGLRIGDALTVGPERLQARKLLLYTQKTKVPVFVPLPGFVVDALNGFRHSSDKYYFWTGQGKLTTRIGNMSRALSKVFELAKVVGGHAHRFRDTFAVELLLKGVPIETVSILLGHSSIRITEKHYSPWVSSRQAELERAVSTAWGDSEESYKPAPQPIQEPELSGTSGSSPKPELDQDQLLKLPVPSRKLM